MFIGQIITADVANGPGIRLSIFVSGCTNHCKGCFQPQTWNFEYGEPYTKDTENYLVNELSKPYYRGITILGGEPFEPCNQVGLYPLIKRIKEELPEKDIWMFTGFTLENELAEGGSKHTNVTESILRMADVLVDGRFIEEEKDIRLKFRGSRNQRIIDLKKTFETGKTVLSDLNN